MNIQNTDTLVSSRVISIENIENPIVAATEQVFDYDLNKFQSEINKSTNDTLSSLDDRFLPITGGTISRTGDGSEYPNLMVNYNIFGYVTEFDKGPKFSFNVTSDGNVYANSFVVKNGTSTQVLMADGSLKEWGDVDPSDIESITNIQIDELFV